jgi:hypothetical protein
MKVNSLCEGGFMNIAEYIDYIDQISEKTLYKLDNNNINEPLKIDSPLICDFMYFVDIKRELITDSEKKIASYRYINPIINLDVDSETKILLTAIYIDLINSIRRKEFIKSFEKYNENHPIFKGNDLFSYVRDCRELINYNNLSWIKKQNDICQYNSRFYKVNGYLREELLEYIHFNCTNYKKYIRIHPYYSYEKMPPMYLKEEALRPVDPKWIKSLKLYKGQSTGGHYFLILPEEIKTEVDKLKYWEYSILKIRSLEIYAQRNNSGNLSMMIEEVKDYKEFDEYFIAKCIHLDTSNGIGTDIDNAVLNHIDLAINVYDKDVFKERSNQSLSDGRIVDATYRIHLLRLENVPFKLLVNLSYLFFDTQTLTKEWILEQFGS